MKLFVKFVPVAIGAMLFMSIWYAGKEVRHQVATWYPAIAWRGAQAITPMVRPGGELVVEYKAVIHRQCPSDLRGFLVAEDGTVPVRFPVVAGGYRKPTDGEEITVRVSIVIPRQSDAGLGMFRPGPMVYRATATRYCADGVEEDNAIPDVLFTLEAP